MKCSDTEYSVFTFLQCFGTCFALALEFSHSEIAYYAVLLKLPVGYLIIVANWL